jgi:hypothetical protein
MSPQESGSPDKLFPEEFREARKSVHPSHTVGPQAYVPCKTQTQKDPRTEPLQDDSINQDDVARRSTEQLDNALPLDGIMLAFMHNDLVDRNSPKYGKDTYHNILPYIENDMQDTKDMMQDTKDMIWDTKELSVDLFRELKMNNQEVPLPKSALNDHDQNQNQK